MDLDPISSRAIQSLSTDVGTLSARVAILSGALSDLGDQARSLSMGSWEQHPAPNTPVEEGTEVSIVIRGDDALKLNRLLQTIHQLQ